MDNVQASELDMVVVGAGIAGIAAANFYLHIHPKCRLALLEKDTCLGGVWNSRRSYKSFWTQWTVGAAEFSNMSMEVPPEEDTYYDVFKAEHTTRYLEKYVDQRVYDGYSLRSRIRLGVNVESIEKENDGWIIVTAKPGSSAKETFHASKVIIASGLFSEPSIPVFPGQQTFEALIMHSVDFGESTFLDNDHIKNVTVVGGGKSAADIVYTSVKAGKKVSWVIKATGRGPGFFLAPRGAGSYRNAIEMSYTRLAASITPSLLHPNSWWVSLLHGTQIGRKVLGAVWAFADQQSRDEVNVEGRPAKQGFKNLKTHTPIFWQNGTGGLLNHPDFYETIANDVEIHQGDIKALDGRLVQLTNSVEIPTDILCLATGYVPSLQFFSADGLTRLGLPCTHSAESMKTTKFWARLEEEMDYKVLARFPMLKNPPSHHINPQTTTPYRLYRCIAPLEDDTIAFVGHAGIGTHFFVAECQAIWATAYLDKKIVLPPLQERQRDVAQTVAWCRRRYLSSGQSGNWLLFDMLPYCDTLMEQLGLKSYQKDWFKNFFSPYLPSDLAGLCAEYVSKYGCDDGES